MAETFDSRFGVRIWGASTDGPTRVEFNANFAAITSQAAIDTQGLLSARPVAGIAGRYYYATDNENVYRDNGSAWKTVGSKSQDSMIASSGAASVPLTANGASGQTADVFKAQVNGVDVASITKDGDILGRSFQGKFISIIGTVTGQVVGLIKGAAGQSADILQVRDNTNADLLKIAATGAIAGKYLVAGDGTGAIGTNGTTTPASMTMFGGAPALEVYGKKGGASGAFTEYLYLHHVAADSSVVARRLGLLMQIGDASGDVSKSGGIGIESAVASAANPDLILYRADATVMRFKSDGTVGINASPTIAGALTIVPTSAAALTLGATGVNQQIGTQGTINDMYFRSSPSGTFFWYAGGVHSDTSGDASGGARVASLSKVGSTGKFVTGALRATNLGDTNTASKDLVAAFGNEGSAHVGFSASAMQAYSATTTAGTLGINTYGGDVQIGNGSAFVDANGKFRISGKRVTVASSAPASPAVGDVWIEV